MSLSDSRVREVPGWAEFAQAFCAGYNARKNGVRDEDGGEEFVAALNAGYEKWHARRCAIEHAARALDEAIDRELSDKHWGGMGGPKTRHITAGIRSHLTTAQVRLRKALDA